MNSIEPKIIYNKKYIGAVKINNFKSDIYKSYNFNYLNNNLPKELIIPIINKLCSLLIVVITYDNRLQYINPIDNKIIKEIKLNENTNYYNYNLKISEDGLALIIYHDHIIIEYLYDKIKNLEDKYKFEYNWDYNEYNYRIIQDVCISKSIKYIIKSNNYNIRLYDITTGINIANYVIDEKYSSHICFSPDETKIAIIGKNENPDIDSNVYVLSITSNNTFELIYSDYSLSSGNYSLSWCNNNLLLINIHTDGFYYTNATYSTLINILTKETQTIMLPVQHSVIKWENNNLLYIDDNKLYIHNTTQSVINKQSVQYIKTFRDYYICNFYIFEEILIFIYTNKYGDNMILIDNKLTI